MAKWPTVLAILLASCVLLASAAVIKRETNSIGDRELAAEELIVAVDGKSKDDASDENVTDTPIPTLQPGIDR